MGFSIKQRRARFVIRTENHDAALAAIKSLADRLPMHSSRIWHYAFVDTEMFQIATTLETALGAWRWRAKSSTKDGSIKGIRFTGEKLGDENMLFAAIAPFVEAGSYIEMEGEDGTFWRWVFDGQTAFKVAGQLQFESAADVNRLDPEHLHISGWSKRNGEADSDLGV